MECNLVWNHTRHFKIKQARRANSIWDHKYDYHANFQKAPFSKCFPPTIKRKSSFSNSGFKSVFEKCRFRDGLVWTVGLTRRNKAAFSNFSSLVWTRPHNAHYSILLLCSFIIWHRLDYQPLFRKGTRAKAAEIGSIYGREKCNLWRESYSET